MKVKALRRFRDLKADTTRAVGDEFDASKKRLDELNSTGYGQLVAPVSVEAPEASAEAPETPEDGTTPPEAPEASAEAPETPE